MTKRASKTITVSIEPNGGLLTVSGRTAWMLENLIDVGSKGLTSIERPAPRISHYVFCLRRAGILVETVHESHDGLYAGSHARYFLRSPVKVLRQSGGRS